LSCTGAAQIKTNALIKFLTIATILLLFVQIIFGAFVAGLKAGHIYNSFPLMNGDLIPPEVTLQDLTNLSNPVIVQFYHRMLALLSFSLITLLAYNVYKNFRHSILFYRSVLLVVVCIFQILLGIITLLNNVPVDYALIHQLGAFVVFAVAIALLHPMIGNSQTCRGIK